MDSQLLIIFKAKFSLMAGMEKSGLDEVTCYPGSVFLPSGCQEAEQGVSSPQGSGDEMAGTTRGEVVICPVPCVQTAWL